MKRLTGLVLLVSAALLGGCGGEKLDARQLDWSNGLAYKHGDTEPFTGTVAFNDELPNNAIAFWRAHAMPTTHMQAQDALTGCTETFVKGLAEGDVHCEGVTGKQALTFRIKNEAVEGEAEIDYPNSGDRALELNFSAGVLDGRQRIWSSHGEKIMDATYANNAPVDGQVYGGDGSVVHYKDGKLNGPAVYFDRYNKGPQSEGQYVDGARDGEWQDANSSGNRIFQAIITSQPTPALPDNYRWGVYSLKSHWDHGSPRGEVQGFDKDGQLIFDWTLTDKGLEGDYMDIPEGSSQPRKLVYKDNRLVSGMASP
ncbi:hypothetical protein ABQJ54_10885 [Rhodanobacter sp. Si-c]|uniref:Toxin-antitoxin system YwqK family antitoxin n=1 Tax=Rhodanobacter lycopersici TaxID=3162487 RepID=A0ABV3QGI0_9GAMM